MSDLDLVIRAARTVFPDGERAATIGVKDGAIAAVEAADARLQGAQTLELADDEALMAGVVDSHVHVNDPGRTSWEGFTTATRAAASGGVTTLIDMPLNCIPSTVTVDALETKRKVAADQAYIDVGFWGGAVPGNVPDLKPLHDEGVFGFKCFLLDSGVEEFPPLTLDEVEAAMREIASFDGLLIVHSEDSHAIDEAPDVHGRHYRDFLSSRPREAENLAVKHVIEGARRTGCRVHILHVSSSEALPLIADAKADGVRITAETCPHYLSFTAEDIPDGATQYKCCPPIRESDNRDALWQGLQDGVIDMIVSDHSPSTIDLKNLDTGDFGTAWGGISSVQLGLPAIWSGARERGLTLSDVSRWMSQGPVAQTGLERKGRIEVGADADFVVLAPEETFVVDPKQLQHKNPITAYAGRTLHGVVRSTWLRGRKVDISEPPQGNLLRRGDA